MGGQKPKNPKFRGGSTPTFFPSEEIKVNIPKKEPLKEELNHFINAISNNTPIETTGEIGLQALNISQMILNNN